MQLEEKKEKEENLEKNQNSYYKLKSYLINVKNDSGLGIITKSLF